MSIDFVPPVAQVAGIPIGAAGVVEPVQQAAPVGLVSADDADAILAAAQPAGGAAAAEPTAGTAETPEADTAPVAQPKAAKTPREKLTEQIAKLEARIAKDTAALADASRKLESIDTFASLGVNSLVEIKIGRAETTRNVIGRVIAADGDRYKVYHGEGMDADVVVVQMAQIIRVVPE